MKTYFGFVSFLYISTLIILLFFAFIIPTVNFLLNVKLWTSIFLAILTTALTIYAYVAMGFKYVDPYFLGMIGVLLSLIANVIIKREPKLTPKAIKMKGRLLGFKKYIKTVEVEKLKMFVEENPNYYFDVLPYAYVFGLTDVWIKKFENIVVEAPEWIEITTEECLTFNVLNKTINEMAAKVTDKVSAMSKSSNFSSSNSSSFGGGFSSGGGGFSSGGGGGGGFGAR